MSSYEPYESKEVVQYNGAGYAIIAKEASEVLAKPTPKDKIYTRPGPFGMPLAYVPWSWVAQQLNKAFGTAWSFRFIAEPQVKGDELVVMVELQTPLGIQQAFGSHLYQPNNKNAKYGDALQSAASKALRRAAARWGAGLDLYQGVEVEDETLSEDEQAEAALFHVGLDLAHSASH